MKLLKFSSSYLAAGAPTSNIACHPNKPLVIAGFENASAVLINAQNGKVIANFDCNGNQKGEDDDVKEEGVEGLCFCTRLDYLIL